MTMAFKGRAQSKPLPAAKGPVQPKIGEEPQGQSGGEEISHMPIHDAVAEHGPAQKIEIMHGEGQHEVISHHGGKKHHSSHGSAKEAHDHAATAGGAHEQDEQGPDMGQGEEQPAKIPGMSKQGY
jgi:hypothetical protein